MNAPVRDIRQCGALPLPINIEAEQALLGAILINNDAFARVSDFLKIEHFSEEIHRRVFDVASQLIRAGKVATPVTLKTFLGDADLGGLTIPQYLARLAAEATAIINAEDYGRTIYDLAVRRDLIEIGNTLIRNASDSSPSETCLFLASKTLDELQAIAETAVTTDTRRDPGVCAAAVVERARAIVQGEQQDEGVSTGVPNLDRATGGFQPGTLWIVGGRPRMGKTIIATGFALKVAGRMASCGAQIFSLEVTEDQIIARLLADLVYTPRRPISFGAIMRGELDESDLWALEDAQQRLSAANLALDVSPSLSVADIAARVRVEKARMAKRGVRLAVVFIDYMKFVRASDRYRGQRAYEVGEITRGFKELAKAEGLCVVLLAQVNRAVDGRDRRDRSPGLADLRESGDLEADADVVLFIDRESVRIKQSAEYKAGDPETVDRFLDLQHRADLIVAKTRTGSETTIPIWMDAGSSTFSATAREGV